MIGNGAAAITYAVRAGLFASAAALLLSGRPMRALADEPLAQTQESGPLHVTVTLSPPQPVIGDAVTLTIEVRAQANVEVLMPEFGEALDRFAILDFAPRESLDDDGGLVSSQTYRLQTPSSGTHAIPPILIEYVDRRPGHPPAPEGLDAYEILTERLDFTVQSVIPSGADADLKPPLGRLDPIKPPAPARWPWALGAAAVLLAASPLAWNAWRRWRRMSRRRSAYDIAHARLAALLARDLPTAEQLDAFFVELSGTIRQYLEDRFDLRAPELTTEEFLAAVGETPDLSRDHQTLLRGFLREADLVKFAGAQPSPEDVAKSVEAAQRFLDETKMDAPLIDEQETSTAATPH